AHLTRVVSVIVTDADVLDLVRRELELRQQVDEARLGRRRRRADWVARVPYHVVVAVLDQIAAEGELDLQAGERIGVGHAAADVGRARAGAAVEARECNDGRGLRAYQGGARGGNARGQRQ